MLVKIKSHILNWWIFASHFVSLCTVRWRLKTFVYDCAHQSLTCLNGWLAVPMWWSVEGSRSRFTSVQFFHRDRTLTPRERSPQMIRFMLSGRATQTTRRDWWLIRTKSPKHHLMVWASVHFLGATCRQPRRRRPGQGVSKSALLLVWVRRKFCFFFQMNSDQNIFNNLNIEAELTLNKSLIFWWRKQTAGSPGLLRKW